MTDPNASDPKDVPLSPLLLLHSRPTARSREEYIEAVRTYVMIKFDVRVLGSPQTDLNRRFSLLAKRYDLPMRNVLSLLERDGHILLIPHRGNLIAFPAAQYNEYSQGMEFETVERIYDDSLRDIGRKIPTKKYDPPKGSSFFGF